MPPKRLQLLVAYLSLATTTAVVVAYDAHVRSLAEVPRRTEVPREDPHGEAPHPMTRLSESPFLRHIARNESASIRESATARNEDSTANRVRIAPAGVYFLTVPIRTEGTDGSQILTPGTRVRLLARVDGKLRVSRDGTTFVVEEWQVTDDVEVAGRLARTRPT
jgi:hypothetical protein